MTTIIQGQKEISRYVGRSWETIQWWIDHLNFPARKIDGRWESDAQLITEWRREQIREKAPEGASGLGYSG